MAAARAAAEQTEWRPEGRSLEVVVVAHDESASLGAPWRSPSSTSALPYGRPAPRLPPPRSTTAYQSPSAACEMAANLGCQIPNAQQRLHTFFFFSFSFHGAINLTPKQKTSKVSGNGHRADDEPPLYTVPPPHSGPLLFAHRREPPFKPRSRDRLLIFLTNAISGAHKHPQHSGLAIQRPIQNAFQGGASLLQPTNSAPLLIW